MTEKVNEKGSPPKPFENLARFFIYHQRSQSEILIAPPVFLVNPINGEKNSHEFYREREKNNGTITCEVGHF